MSWYVSHNRAFSCFVRVALVICVLLFAFSLRGASPLAAQGPAPQDGSSIIEADPTDTPPLQPTGLRPFLFVKPFTETYETQYQLRSFFDHRLPLLGGEANENIPGDLRDVNQSITHIFTDESRPNDWNQGYSFYSGHNGLDYGLVSDPVLAPADGTIAYVHPGNCGVVIEHDASEPLDGKRDYSTVYLHLDNVDNAPETQRSRPDRKCGPSARWCEGDSIEKGETIGLSGGKKGTDACRASSSGKHLHFGVYMGPTRGTLYNPRLLDPFGWWSNSGDPWADSRLGGLGYSPQQSRWLWGAPQNPGRGNPGYWGDNIGAQTDDTDASFQKFWPLARRNVWQSIRPDQSDGINPIGTGAWWSKSIQAETSNVKRNWAVWGLHVPDTAQYSIQVHILKLSQNTPTSTSNAIYTVRIPQEDGSLDIWASEPVDQRVSNEWLTLTKGGGGSVFELQGGSVVLIELDDITGINGQAVVFDAVRLKRESPPGPPPPDVGLRRVGFVVDNTSSMQAQGKIDAVKAAIPPWIDLLEASGVPYEYSLEAFAEDVPPVQRTDNAAEIKGWIGALTANDNGRPNYDCPEESLAAIAQLAPVVQGGDALLLTDDLPKSPILGTVEAFIALTSDQVKLHSILLPKTCWIGGGGDPTGWLAYRFLTLFTGGTYQSVETDRTSEALQIVLSEMQSNSQLSSVSQNITDISSNGVIRISGIETYEVPVDETVSQANFLLSILEGNLSLSTFRPDGTPVDPADLDVTFIDSGGAQYFQVVNPAPGTWQVQVSGTGEYVSTVSADSTIQFDYLGDVRGSPGVVMQLLARLPESASITSFVIEQTDGQPIATVNLYDDGREGDMSVGDGVYTGWYVPTVFGDFRMRVVGTTEAGTPFSRIDSRLIRVQSLSVEAPSLEIVPAGTSHTFNFTVRNTGTAPETYGLTASSGSSWILQAPPASITVAPGGTSTVAVIVAVPDNAVPNTIDIVRLSAVNQADRTFIDEDTTGVIVPDQDDVRLGQVFLPIIFKNYAPGSQPTPPVNTPTHTPANTPTATATATATPTDTPTATATAADRPTNTPTATATATARPTDTPTATATATNTPTYIPTPTLTNTPTSTPTCNSPGTPGLVSPGNGSVTSDNTPTFDWDPASNSNEYQIQVDNNSNFSSPEIDVTLTSSIYTPSSGLSDGTYYWRVRGHNISGGCNVFGSWSSVWSVTIGRPPAAPSDLQATPLDSTHIRLEWVDKSDNESGFRIYDGSIFVATVGPNTTSYTVGGLAPDSYHCYHIYAFNDYGNSAWTDWACATTAPTVGPVVYNGHSIDDEGGDNNGNCGETFELHVELLNQGTGTATDVNAVISTSDPYVTLEDPNLNYFDIPGGAWSANDWVDVTTDPNIPDGHVIHFELDITASNGGPWTDSFDVVVACVKPDLVVTDITLMWEDPQPGDAMAFVIDITNQGIGSTGPWGSFRVACYMDGGANEIDSEWVTNLDVGELIGVICDWTAEEGTHTITAVVDPDALIPELDEGNNDSSMTFSVVGEPPEAPSNLQATPLDSTHIRLDWIDESNNESGFRIYDGSIFVATVGANTTSYTVGGLAPDSYHCYHIYAFNDYGNSAWTDWACTTTPGPSIGMIETASYGYPYNRLRGLGYSVSLLPVSADIDTFRQYNIVYLPVGWADGFSGNYSEIEAQAADYRTYVSEGGGLFVDQPNPFMQPDESVSPSLLPYSITFYNPYNTSDWPPIIVNPDHYITSGLPREDMPGPADQITAIDPAYAVLVRGQTTNSPSLAVAEYGQGRVVVQTSHSGAGNFSDEVYRRMIEWVSSDVDTVGSYFHVPSDPTPVPIKETTP